MGEIGEAEEMAGRAVQAVERARAAGGQLDLFGAPAVPAGEPEEGRRGPGRPKGARNKAKTGLRELMVGQGFRDPASQLAYLAGLNSGEDPFLVAVGRAQALLEAAGTPVAPKMLMGMAIQILREMRLANDALLPYVFNKLTPDVTNVAAQMVVQMAPPGAAGASGTAIPARVGPPPMPSDGGSDD